MGSECGKGNGIAEHVEFRNPCVNTILIAKGNAEDTNVLLKERVGEVLLRNNTIGFNTYREQHVNQTPVGIVIGTNSTETDDA
jgi:hypothetical protein